MTRAAYQSGSSRATPGSASKAVLCGTGRSTTTVRALVGGVHSGGSGGGVPGGRVPKVRSSRRARSASSMSPTAATTRPLRIKRDAARCLRVCCVSFLQVVGRAVGIVGIGVARELGLHQRARGDRGGTLAGLVDRGDGLGAPLVDHVAVEARLGERQPQELEAFLAVGRQHAQAAAQAIERGAEADRCRGILLALPEGLRGERSGAVAEQRGHEAW